MPVDIEQAIDLRTNHNLSYEKIGQIQGVSPQAIHQALQRYGIDSGTLDTFKKNRADLLAGLQAKIYKAIDDDSIKKMIERRGLTDMGILYDKERIERGLSDGASKPMIMVQINTPGGAEVRAKQVDNAQFGGTFGGIKDEGKT
jgi:hypothetical protein